MAKYVSCTKDIRQSVKAQKRYKIDEQDEGSFSFYGEDGVYFYCLRKGCSHLRNGGEWIFHDEPAADLNLSVDTPTKSMKELADHCERAAAALERIKDALK